MLQAVRQIFSGATNGASGPGNALSLSPQSLLCMKNPNPSTGRADSTLVVHKIIAQRNQPQTTALSPQQVLNYLELDFTPNSPSFICARDNEILYWSNTYKELSHPNLFTRAAKTRTRLIPDLKKTLIELSKSKMRRLLNQGKLIYDLEPPESRYDLRLTGHPDAMITNRILMTGYVWIQCSDRFSISKIRKRLEELTWLKSDAWAPVHVYLDPIVAANAESQSEYDVYDYRPGASLGGGFQLHADIARAWENDSPCGRPCRSRITLHSKVVNESFCRVGGVLRVNGSVDVFITTAHGILSYFLAEIAPLLNEGEFNENQLGNSDETSDETSNEREIEKVLSQGRRGRTDPDRSHADKLGYIDMSQLQQWEPLKPFDTITYIAQAEQIDADSKWNLRFRDFDADYALFTLSDPAKSPRSPLPNNSYAVNPKYSTFEIKGSASGDDSQIAPHGEYETCYILLDAQAAIPVQLFLNEVEISINGLKFQTLKLRAPNILSRGTSGSWVVRGEKFCGVIIAVYEFEPYALILPCAAVSRDLMKLGTDIKTVSLPPVDHTPPRSHVGGAQLSTTIISAFETLGVRPPEILSLPPSEPTTTSPSSSTRDTPPSTPQHKPQKPKEGHSHTRSRKGKPRPPPSHEYRALPTPEPSSIGAPICTVTCGQASGPDKIPTTGAARLRDARLSMWLQESGDENVVLRLNFGEARNPKAVSDYLNHWGNGWNSSF
ncbi:hypothetical protein F5X98DRAFT_385106 [Xylaria grammica]|nr:hypothetical protein F5X98DRAFT_385106 [Xylaria grammica]